MPLTFPAHQAPVLPLKLWKPRWFDGTALVIGSGSPDLFNAFVRFELFDSHEWAGVGVAVLFTIVYAMLFRRYGADGLFGSLPDFGRLRLRHYRVLGRGHPRLLITVLSSFLGVISHVVVDSFTHRWRFGSTMLGLNDIVFDGPFGQMSEARILQYIGHSLGSVVGVILFVIVVSDRHLGEWYGTETIAKARSAPTHLHAGRTTGLIVGAACALGVLWASYNRQHSRSPSACAWYSVFSSPEWRTAARLVGATTSQAR